MHEQMNEQSKQNESVGAYQEWQQKKKIERMIKKQEEKRKEQEKEQEKMVKAGETQEAYKEWLLLKHLEKEQKDQENLQKQMKLDIKQQRESKEKARRRKQCTEEFNIWATIKCQKIKANPRAFNASNRLAVSATRKMKEEKYGEKVEQSYNPLKVKQAAQRPQSSYLPSN